MTHPPGLSRRQLLTVIGAQALAAVAGSAPLPAEATATPDANLSVDLAVRQFRVFLVGNRKLPAFISLNSSSENTPEPEHAEKFATSLRSDGTWSDIDYASKSPSQWPADVHCSRMVALAAAAVSPGVAPARVSTFIAAMHQALAYWIANDPQCPNWWYNQIGIPKHLGPLALLLGDRLTPTEIAYITQKSLPRAKLGGTGQNKVWFASNRLMLGLLTADPAQLAAASASLWSEVHLQTGEGIQPDFSFQQHGPQQQFGNYGMGFAVEVCRWATVLRGTPWALPSENLAAFYGFLFEGENWVLWRGRMDISACGRQIAPGNTRRKAATIARVMEAMQTVDVAHVDEYASCVERNKTEGDPRPNDLNGSRYYWRSDYLVHRSPTTCATLKMHSRRTIGTELVNNENLSGLYLADGALYLYGRGDEYEGIFPAWNWRQLPGTTCPQNDGPLPPPVREKPGETFVGGVTDGRVSVGALTLDRDGLTARKAYFFDGDEVLCLGAGIAVGEGSAGGVRIVTTINQCLRRGNIARRPASVKGAGATAGDWIEHNGFRYTFPGSTAPTPKVGAQTGNWKHVFQNPLTPRDDITLDVFSLTIDHGVNPQAASYAYIAGPAAQAPKARILISTAKLMAAQLASGAYAFVFWEPGQQNIERGGSVGVDEPCVLLLDPKTGAGVVADPTQALTSLELTVGRTGLHITFPQQPGAAGRPTLFSAC